MAMKEIAASVDEYIVGFPEEVQVILQKIRTSIVSGSHDINESISYGMPAYKLKGKPLVYFAGYKNHIGFYATPSGHEEFEKELAVYKRGKGSVQFPLNKPIPFKLIERMVKFRIEEVLGGKE